MMLCPWQWNAALIPSAASGPTLLIMVEVSVLFHWLVGGCFCTYFLDQSHGSETSQ